MVGNQLQVVNFEKKTEYDYFVEEKIQKDEVIAAKTNEFEMLMKDMMS